MNIPALSDRPENLIERRRTSFADVFMLVAKDGPIYAIIIVVGVLAMKGTASTSEMVMTGALSLLARSWPRPIQMGAATLVAMGVVARLIVACAPAAPAALSVRDAADVAAYGSELDSCLLDGKDAGSLAVYERCAEGVDRKYGRKDGGAP